MTNISVTNTIKSYHLFERSFWLSYKALELIIPKEEWDKIKMQLLTSKKISNDLIEPVKEAYELKKAEIDLEWTQKNEEAKLAGTTFHEYIHNMLVTDILECKRAFGIHTDVYKVLQIENFINSDGLFPEFRMEVKLSDDFTLIGIADLIIKDGNHIKIIDWKIADKIDKSSYYDVSIKKKKVMKYPLSHIEDCSLCHYLLQLSMYAWMLLQINPDFIIDSLEIVHIKDGKKKHIYPVEYLKKDIDMLLKWHIKDMKLLLEFLKCKEKIYI